MSFEQDNAAMLDKMDALLTGIDQRYGDVSKTVRTFYVNQLTGSDTNAGTVSAPFATLQKAMDNGVEGAVTNVYLTSDYAFGSSVFVPSGAVSITGYGGIRRRVTFTDGVVGDTLNGGVYAPRILSNYSGCNLRLQALELVLGTYGALVPNKYAIWNSPMSNIFLNDVNLVTPAGSDQTLFNNGPGLSFVFQAGVADAGMPGRWVGGVAAGTDPDTLANIRYTNLGAL